MDFPKQLVHKYWTTLTEDPSESATKFFERRYKKVLEIHSHHTLSLGAKPSETDDKNERSTIIYAIVGKTDHYFPEVTVRTFNTSTQKHVPLTLEQVFKTPFNNPTNQYDLSGVEVDQ